MTESIVMKELREVRDKTSEKIKDMNADQLKEYFQKQSNLMLNEIYTIREQKLIAIQYCSNINLANQ